LSRLSPAHFVAGFFDVARQPARPVYAANRRPPHPDARHRYFATPLILRRCRRLRRSRHRRPAMFAIFRATARRYTCHFRFIVFFVLMVTMRQAAAGSAAAKEMPCFAIVTCPQVPPLTATCRPPSFSFEIHFHTCPLRLPVHLPAIPSMPCSAKRRRQPALQAQRLQHA